jgi:chemosensory pili system protein ChpA (sensor histidine kinase/response regulator)
MQPSPVSMIPQPASGWHPGHAQTLQALLPGIQDSLDQLRQLVEDAGLEQITLETLEAIRQNGQQLHDTFAFAGLVGPAYAMKQALAALDACHHPDAYTETLGDALASLLIALPAYVDLMAQGEADCPTLLLFPINALRLAMNRGAIGAAEVFAATGGEALIDTVGVDPLAQDPLALRALAQRYRPGVMHAILIVLREASDARALAGLSRVAEKLEHAATTSTVARSWWILRGLLAAVADGSVPQSGVRPVLLRLERLLGGLATAGETPEQCELHRQTAAQALYALGRVPHLVGLPNEVVQTYDLSHRVISPEQQERLQRALGDAGSQALAGVAASIRDELQVVKESLDVLSRTPQPAADELKVLVGVTQGICATLAILDRPDLMAQMDRAATRLAAWANAGQVAATEWPEVAQSVLAVEAALVSLSGRPDTTDLGSIAPELQFPVVSEVLVDLHHMIEELERQDSGHVANEVVRQLEQAAAALALAGLAEAGHCFDQLAQALPQMHKGQPIIEALADALQSLALYLERWGEQPFADQAALAAAVDQTRRVMSLLPVPVSPVVADQSPVSVPLNAAVDLDLNAIFSEEAEEIMAQVGPALLRWQIDAQDREALVILRRGFHTLKGSGRMAGATAIGELAWGVERSLNAILEGKKQADRVMVAWVAHAVEQVTEHLQNLQQPLSAAGQHCVDQLAALANGEAVGMPAAPAEWASAPLDDAVETEIDTTALTPLSADLPTVDSCLLPMAEATGVEFAATEFDATSTTETNPQPEFTEPMTLDADPEASETALLSELFEREASGYLDRVEAYLRQVAAGVQLPLDPEILRVFHTLKGTARTVHRESLADRASALDRWVKAVLSVGKPLSPAQVDLLAHGVTACRLALPATTEIAVDEDWLQRLTADRERLEHSTDSESGSGVDPEIRAIFLEEAVDLLAHMDVLFGNDCDSEELLPIDALMGDLHTFKGGARMSGAQQLGDLAHALETFLGRVATGDANAESEPRVLLRQALDTLQGQLDQWAEGLPTHIPHGLLERLGGGPMEPSETAVTAMNGYEDETPTFQLGTVRQDQAQDGVSEPAAVERGKADISLQPDATADLLAFDTVLPDWWPQPLPGEIEETVAGNEQIRVPAQTLDRLLSLIGELIVVNGRIEQPVRELASYAREIARTIDRLRRQLRELELEAESRIVFQHADRAGESAAGDFDPLEFDRYSRLQQLSRALGESVTDLVSLQELVSGQQQTSEAALQIQRRLAGELQGDLLRTRMIPFEFHGARLRRIVRQTAEALDKQATLEITGGETELDRQVLDRMVAPLEHLLRNALAHGIEPSVERLRLGKPAQGQVSLRVSREGSQVLLEIADDGRGLDAAAILARARARGLVGPDEQLGETQIFHLILAPGLSTAEQVSQIAGRGVGMDVVHNQIKACGGRLEIISQRGQGSTFRVWLPYTLAVSDCLLLKVGPERYAVPMSGIQGVMRLYADQLAEWQEGSLTHLNHLDVDYRLVGLASLLGVPESGETKLEGEHPVLLVNVAGLHWALVADSLLGTQEVVVRSVGSRVAAVPGISGATLLSDGGVVLILDLQSLVDTRGRLGSEGRSQGDPAATVAGARALRVMVVDDSITVRRVTARLLEQHGMTAMTARDGVEALQKIQEQMPDLILLDVEMPRMDGFELLANLKSNAALQAIPVVMITSRTGDKHRNRALDLGAAAYLGKPYQEAELLETIGHLTQPQRVGLADGSF